MVSFVKISSGENHKKKANLLYFLAELKERL